MTLGEKIRLMRTSIRMSQREFAKEVGCAQSFISACEGGTKHPSYTLLLALDSVAKKYKVKVKLI